MDKWRLGKYVIDAKKNIDSLLFIIMKLKKISNLNLRQRVDMLRQSFYINCCIALDKSYPKEKKIICKDEIISSIYYERDKNGAHKDDNYEPKEYSSLNEMAEEMKMQLSKVRELCKNSLPEAMTLDYVPHDKELFRLLYGITAEKEEKIKHRKYPMYGKVPKSDSCVSKRIFQEIEDIKRVDNQNDYAVVVENGINFYESLQNCQDACIRINVLYGQNMWCTVNKKVFEQMLELQKEGFFSEFGIPIIPESNEQQKKFVDIMSRYNDGK